MALRVTGVALRVARLTLLAVPEVRRNPASGCAAPASDNERVPSTSTRVRGAGTANEVSRATPDLPACFGFEMVRNGVRKRWAWGMMKTVPTTFFAPSSERSSYPTGPNRVGAPATAIFFPFSSQLCGVAFASQRTGSFGSSKTSIHFVRTGMVSCEQVQYGA